MGIASWAGSVVVTAAGLITLNIFVLTAASYGAFFGSVDKKKKQARLDAQSQLWDLSQQPLPGFHHKFHAADDGVDLHYVEGGDTSPGSPLVIFIHGFPDSWFIWHQQLSSPDLQAKAHLIAVDLPGYGGSGCFPVASANSVLTSLTNFVLAQKSNKSHNDCILVTHDWGSVVGFRLASEVGFLFTRCIILNAIHPAIAISNLNRATSSARRFFITYLQNPARIGALRAAFQSLKPVLIQLKCSYYISVFRLPLPLARQLVKMGDLWFPRMLAKMARVRNQELYLANVLGPSKSEADGYPVSILARQDLNKRIDGMISYYRGSLAFGRWKKPENIQLLVSAYESKTTNAEPQARPGRFQCPVTIVYGGRDNAFHRPFCFGGLEDFLQSSQVADGMQRSYLLCFPKAAHWTMVSTPGRESVEALIQCTIDNADSATMKEKISKVDADVVFEIEN